MSWLGEMLGLQPSRRQRRRARRNEQRARRAENEAREQQQSLGRTLVSQQAQSARDYTALNQQLIEQQDEAQKEYMTLASDFASQQADYQKSLDEMQKKAAQKRRLPIERELAVAQRRKRQAGLRQRRGRVSTILTDRLQKVTGSSLGGG